MSDPPIGARLRPACHGPLGRFVLIYKYLVAWDTVVLGSCFVCFCIMKHLVGTEIPSGTNRDYILHLRELRSCLDESFSEKLYQQNPARLYRRESFILNGP